ncbi:MAG: Gfo/Idh/MocA family oxidoreductase, partial [Planctomycetales bacterium]|nr:Gfo/Idh/MocA family oxidoreductase [Planctomycetales bacterium]
TEDEARRNVKVYDQDYHDLLDDPNVEAIIIALPLFLHHPVALEAMAKGKHVLTEKLMAHDVGQCKEMARAAEHTKLYLAVGHQRHYSVLYDNAVNLLKWNTLGELQFIRAQWHRSNLPGSDGWKPFLPGGEKAADGKLVDEIKDRLASYNKKLAEWDDAAAKGRRIDPDEYGAMKRLRDQYAAWDIDQAIAAKAAQYGYEEISLGGSPPRTRTAYEELCRWRLWDRTGGGLMAELGSHQLDAASIFCSAMRNDGKHVHPLCVHGVGGRQTFPYDRDAEDHVYCTFEFPGPGYEAPPADDKAKYGYYDPYTGYPAKGIDKYADDPSKKIVMTYSSIMGNDWGSYGETVMGTKGTLILHREQEVMLFKSGAPAATKVKVSADKGSATMSSYETGGGSPAAASARAAQSGPVSRGYTEEIEHWAWCIRNPAPENHPKCTPEIALGDAVIALTARLAIANSTAADPAQRAKSYIAYEDAWFDPNSDATPDGSKPRSAEDALAKPRG